MPPRSMRWRRGWKRAGVAVKREPAALADQRFVSGLISFADPSGNRLEAFHGAQIADEPFRPGRSISGFRTGPLGMGHAVLMVTEHRRGAGVLSRSARLPHQRLHPQADHRVFPARQSAASQSWRCSRRRTPACIT